MTTTFSGPSIQHPLGKDESIPKKIEESRLEYLTTRIRTGEVTRDERDELARSFIRLGLKIAANFAARRPQDADDFASVALFGIAHAIEHAKERLEDNNITGYIIGCIRGFLRQFFSDNHPIRVPRRTYTQAVRDGCADKLQKVTVLVLDERELDSSKTNMLHQRIKTKPAYGSVFELREMLTLSARNDMDRSIIKLRLEGYTDVEIAEQLDISAACINKRRREIEERFDTILKKGA